MAATKIRKVTFANVEEKKEKTSAELLKPLMMSSKKAPSAASLPFPGVYYEYYVSPLVCYQDCIRICFNNMFGVSILPRHIFKDIINGCPVPPLSHSIIHKLCRTLCFNYKVVYDETGPCHVHADWKVSTFDAFTDLIAKTGRTLTPDGKQQMVLLLGLPPGAKHGVKGWHHAIVLRDDHIFNPDWAYPVRMTSYALRRALPVIRTVVVVTREFTNAPTVLNPILGGAIAH
jgi:hypothetical protein